MCAYQFDFLSKQALEENFSNRIHGFFKSLYLFTYSQNHRRTRVKNQVRRIEMDCLKEIWVGVSYVIKNVNGITPFLITFLLTSMDTLQGEVLVVQEVLPDQRCRVFCATDKSATRHLCDRDISATSKRDVCATRHQCNAT